MYMDFEETKSFFPYLPYKYFILIFLKTYWCIDQFNIHYE